MDCAECASHVQRAISSVEGVKEADVLLGAEKAIVRFDVQELDIDRIRRAVREAGYEVGEDREAEAESRGRELTRKILTLFGAAVGAVLFVAVLGEWLGLFDALIDRIPWYLALGAVLVGGYPIFANVIRNALRGRVVAHTLMSLGAVAAMVAGEWVTAAVVVFFMRLGDYAERFTADKARGSIRGLEGMAPRQARLERDGEEEMVPLDDLSEGDVVIVRPGERIPVDGVVLSGQATIDQSAITGESMPVEVASGTRVFAATIPQLGSLRVRAERVGGDSTFGKVIRMVEEAEANRSEVQRMADKFSGYYLPLVALIAAGTYALSGDAMATVAVLVVACSCSFALATPIAILASVGAAARRGLLVKGGKYIESLDKASVLLVDKTGTLTLGKPRIREIVPGAETGAAAMRADAAAGEEEVLRLAASVERYSEHPVARGIIDAALERGLELKTPEDFQALPGVGVRGRLSAGLVEVRKAGAESDGATLVAVSCDGAEVGRISLSDETRPEVPRALAAVRELGIRRIELLTGDNEGTGRRLAEELGVDYQAELLPEDKIRIVREYQEQGMIVVMVGDGVNDAPALAQADIGVAMGAAGSDIAVEAAHVALLRNDWTLVPELLSVAQRTMRVVRGNIWFTGIYNLVGLTLAALGILPPVLAAAAQSLPDLGILANSSRLLRQPSGYR